MATHVTSFLLWYQVLLTVFACYLTTISSPSSYHNYPSALMHPKFIDSKLLSELKLGRIAGSFTQPPLDNLVISGLFMILFSLKRLCELSYWACSTLSKLPTFRYTIFALSPKLVLASAGHIGFSFLFLLAVFLECQLVREWVWWFMWCFYTPTIDITTAMMSLINSESLPFTTFTSLVVSI